MKKSNIETTYLTGFKKQVVIVAVSLMFLLTAGISVAKTNPMPAERALAFARAAELNNGISISWLEQTWNNKALRYRPFGNTDFVLLKKLGFRSIRLPVAFEYYHDKNVPVEKIFKQVDGVLAMCRRYGFKLVIDYHYGKIDDKNYTSATALAISTWMQVTKRYAKVDPGKLFFEIYNEPPHMDPQRWKDAAYNIVTAIRKIDKRRTLLVGASNYNSIYELSRTERLADENVIYIFHFYEPFFFTHQGADWVGNQVATTGVTFPYDEKNFPQLNAKAKGTWGETNYFQYKRDGNQRSIKDKLQIVKNWAGKFNVPLLCSEYGVYNKYTDEGSRCRYISAVRKSLFELKIPGMIWDYNTNFSIFAGRPSLGTLSACMKDALGNNKTN